MLTKHMLCFSHLITGTEMLRVKHLALGNKSTRRTDEFIQCVHELFKDETSDTIRHGFTGVTEAGRIAVCFTKAEDVVNRGQYYLIAHFKSWTRDDGKEQFTKIFESCCISWAGAKHHVMQKKTLSHSAVSRRQ